MAFKIELMLGSAAFSSTMSSVVVSGEHSTWAKVDSGVPQGTVLGPLLFLAYINDLPNNINSNVRLFADDCVLYSEIQNEFDHISLQEDLNTLVNWQNEWQMGFNAKKCFTMRLTHAKKHKIFNYKLSDSILQETKSHSYLGVTLTSDLSWNDHINQTSSKANRTLGFVIRNLHQCPQDIKVSAYKTLVRPLVEYSSSVWEPYTKNLINKLESVKRRAARFCLNDFRSKSPGCVTIWLRNWSRNHWQTEDKPGGLSSSIRQSTVTYPFHLVTSRSRPPDPHGIQTPEHSPHSQQARIATNILLCLRQSRTGIVFQTLF